jgi:hypothetical protein
MSDCYNVLLTNGVRVYVSASNWMYAAPAACKKYIEEHPEDPDRHNVKLKDFLPPEQGGNYEDIAFTTKEDK